MLGIVSGLIGFSIAVVVLVRCRKRPPTVIEYVGGLAAAVLIGYGALKCLLLVI